MINQSIIKQKTLNPKLRWTLIVILSILLLFTFSIPIVSYYGGFSSYLSVGDSADVSYYSVGASGAGTNFTVGNKLSDVPASTMSIVNLIPVVLIAIVIMWLLKLTYQRTITIQSIVVAALIIMILLAFIQVINSSIAGM